MPLSRNVEKMTESVIASIDTHLEEEGLETIGQPTEDNVVTITITDTETPAGSPAIAFTLPISEKKVMMMKPTTAMMVQIEQEVNRKHKNCGDFERNLVMLARIICKFDEKEGEKCVSYAYLMNLDIEDVMSLTQASQTFFRSVVTKSK